MIVVDLGCKAHGTEVSIPKLVGRFHPEVLFGFDPHPMLEEGVSCLDGTAILTRRMAAWTTDGTLAFTFDGTRSAPDLDPAPDLGKKTVPCFDFARWLWLLPKDELVVKMDVEGCEYPLLRRMVVLGTDALVSLLLVEWHEQPGWWGPGRVSEMLRCPVELW